ncbi:MAG: NAD(P)H-hydrate dehydratase [Campylobacteraceae bacterium]
MQKIFKETNFLDKKAVEKYLLSEEILMENAASSMANFIKEKTPKNSKILILCGKGNNGADGYSLARMLNGSYDVSVLVQEMPKSELCILQSKRAKLLHVKEVREVFEADVFVDAIFGSGQREITDKSVLNTLLHVNTLNGLKIACDMPTGLFSSETFRADFTLTFGALKESLFYDNSKSFVGEIKCCDLGIDRSFFEEKNNTFLLEKSDLNLPIRKNTNTNKGDFGYLSVIKGEDESASILSSMAGFRFGAGLVSLVGEKSQKIPYNIMQTKNISPKTTALVCGMGLGNVEVKKEWFDTLPTVLDADMLHKEITKEITQTNKNCVLTPHPKEFSSLLKIFTCKYVSVEEIQKDRFHFAREFSLTCKAVLVLKGANTLIAHEGKVYVCTLGNSALAKGGSGDVLAGMIGSLLAQGRSPLDASINAVLAHSLVANNYKANNYSLTPQDLIEGIKWL